MLNWSKYLYPLNILDSHHCLIGLHTSTGRSWTIVLKCLSLSHFLNQISFSLSTFVIMHQNRGRSSFSFQKCPSTFACFCDGAFFMSKCSLNYSSRLAIPPPSTAVIITHLFTLCFERIFVVFSFDETMDIHFL